MSENVEKEIPLSEQTKEVMTLFNVDEKTAERIITWANKKALQKMEKWIKNYKRRRKNE